MSRPAGFRFDQIDKTTEEAEDPEEDHICLEISFRRLDWWEMEHWGDVYDERGLWGDLSREDQLKLNKLLVKG